MLNLCGWSQVGLSEIFPIYGISACVVEHAIYQIEKVRLNELPDSSLISYIKAVPWVYGSKQTESESVV